MAGFPQIVPRKELQRDLAEQLDQLGSPAQDGNQLTEYLDAFPSPAGLPALPLSDPARDESQELSGYLDTFPAFAAAPSTPVQPESEEPPASDPGATGEDGLPFAEQRRQLGDFLNRLNPFSQDEAPSPQTAPPPAATATPAAMPEAGPLPQENVENVGIIPPSRQLSTPEAQAEVDEWLREWEKQKPTIDPQEIGRRAGESASHVVHGQNIAERGLGLVGLVAAGAEPYDYVTGGPWESAYLDQLLQRIEEPLQNPKDVRGWMMRQGIGPAIAGAALGTTPEAEAIKQLLKPHGREQFEYVREQHGDRAALAFLMREAPGFLAAIGITNPANLAGVGKFRSAAALSQAGAGTRAVDVARKVDTAVDVAQAPLAVGVTEAAGAFRPRQAAPAQGIVAEGEVGPAPTFYSQLERAIEQMDDVVNPIPERVVPGRVISPARQTVNPKTGEVIDIPEKVQPEHTARGQSSADQIRAFLRDQGVKDEEMLWTGFDDFLAENANRPITKQEALDFLAQNKVEIQEIIKGSDPRQNRLDELVRRMQSILEASRRRSFTPEEQAEFSRLEIEADELVRKIDESPVSRTQYGPQTLPGGENYRELLLTLPRGSEPRSMNMATWAQKNGLNLTDEQLNAEFRSQGPLYQRWQREAGADAYQDWAGHQYRSAHWEEPNVLAHVRFNDRVDADGKKVLFLEEVQSDWHQAGRKYGYRTNPTEIRKRLDELAAEADAIVRQAQQRWESLPPNDPQRGRYTPEENAAFERLNRESVPLEEQLDGEGVRAQKQVPPAPFAKTWPELAFKRMVRWATENGYDRIAWTTGKQQTDRYSLSARFDRVEWQFEGAGKYTIRAYTPDRPKEAIEYTDLDEGDLHAFVGEDLAWEIVRSPSVRGAFSGEQLNTQRKGMEGFYDHILPATVNKLAKKWGTQVGQTTIPAGSHLRWGGVLSVRPDEGGYRVFREDDTAASMLYPTRDQAIKEMQRLSKQKLETVHAIDITPRMRESALAGQPLFLIPNQDAGVGRDLIASTARGAVAGSVAGSYQYLQEEENPTPEGLLRAWGTGAALGGVQAGGARGLSRLEATRRGAAARQATITGRTAEAMAPEIATASPKAEAETYTKATSPTEILERLRETSLLTTRQVAEALGSERPEYLDAVVRFMTEQREKLINGQLTARDVAKAYFLTTVSQGATEITVPKLEAKTGMKFGPEFTFTKKNGQEYIRPEEAAAAWLFTPTGQRALDAIERGVYDAEAWADGARIRQAFGDDRLRSLNVFNERGAVKRGAYNMTNLPDLVPLLNATRGDTQAIAKLIGKLNGIGPAKNGFMKHLLGFGDAPTFDSVEINWWLTGQGNVGRLANREAQFVRDLKRFTMNGRVSRAVAQKILTEGFDALRQAGFGDDIHPDVYNHIIHHWIWDKAKNARTTHEGMYLAQRQALDAPEPATPGLASDVFHTAAYSGLAGAGLSAIDEASREDATPESILARAGKGLAFGAAGGTSARLARPLASQATTSRLFGELPGFEDVPRKAPNGADMAISHVPLSEIQVKPSQYQKRIVDPTNPMGTDPQRVQSIVEKFDPNKFDPIVLRETADGQLELLSGHHRYQAWQELQRQGKVGEQIPAIVRKGLSDEDAVELAELGNISAKEYRPSERIRVLDDAVRRRLDQGVEDEDAIREVASQYGGRRAVDVRKHVDAAALPESVRRRLDDPAQQQSLTLDHAAVLGRAVRAHNLDPAGIDRVIDRLVIEERMTPAQLERALNTFADVVQQGDLFGGGMFDFGDSSRAGVLDALAELNTVVTDLDTERSRLAGFARLVEERERAGKAVPQSYRDAVREAQADIARLEQQKAQAQAALGQRVADSATNGMDEETRALFRAKMDERRAAQAQSAETAGAERVTRTVDDTPSRRAVEAVETPLRIEDVPEDVRARLPNMEKLRDLPDEVKAIFYRTAIDKGDEIDRYRRGKITHRELAHELAPSFGMTAEEFLQSPVGKAFNETELLVLRAAVVDRTARLTNRAKEIVAAGGVDALDPVEKAKLLREVLELQQLQAVGRGAAATAGRSLGQQRIAIDQELAAAVTGGNERIAAEQANRKARFKEKWAEKRIAEMEAERAKREAARGRDEARKAETEARRRAKEAENELKRLAREDEKDLARLERELERQLLGKGRGARGNARTPDADELAERAGRVEKLEALRDAARKERESDLARLRELREREQDASKRLTQARKESLDDAREIDRLTQTAKHRELTAAERDRLAALRKKADPVSEAEQKLADFRKLVAEHQKAMEEHARARAAAWDALRKANRDAAWAKRGRPISPDDVAKDIDRALAEEDAALAKATAAAIAEGERLIKEAQAEAAAAEKRLARSQELQAKVSERQLQGAKRLFERLGGVEVTDQMLGEFVRVLDRGDPVETAKFIRGAMHPKWWQKASDRIAILRYGSMLSATTTHMTNAMGNFLNLGIDIGLKPLAAGLDATHSKLTGSERTRYLAEIAPTIRGAVEGAAAGMKEALYVMKHGIDPTDVAKLDRIRPGFSSGSGKVDFAAEAPLRALVAADKFFRGAARGGQVRALATRQAIREGYEGNAIASRSQEIAENILEFPELLAEADRQAARVVLQENRMDRASRWIMGSRNVPGLDIIVPFVRTPWNIAAQGVGMTPAGFLSAMRAARRNEKGEAVDRIARAAFGTTLIGGTAALGLAGYVTAGRPESERERTSLGPKWQPWSFRVPTPDGAVYVSYQNWGPVAIPLAVGAIVADMAKRGDKVEEGLLAEIAFGVGRFMVDQTFLQGIFDALQALERGGTAIDRAAQGIASQFVPYGAAQRQVNRALGKPFRDPKDLLQALAATTVAFDEVVPERLDRLGKPISPTQTGAGAFVSPLRYSIEERDPIYRELQRANVGLPRPSERIDGIPLTDAEQRWHLQRAGRYIREDLRDLIRDPGFRTAPQGERATLLEKAIREARARAGEELLDRIPETTKDRRKQRGRP